MGQSEHWDGVYGRKPASSVSWYTPHLERSLELIDGINLPPAAAIIDVGGGASTLPSDLLDRGHTNVTVLDLSETALAGGREQLGDRADLVRWVVADITSAELPEAAYDLWHDRAVFHFLTDEEDRHAYVQQVLRSLKPDGHLVVATFGPEGPERCSGLEVVRHDEKSLRHEFGDTLQEVRCLDEVHVTPSGTEQEFVYCLFRKPRSEPVTAPPRT